MGNAPRTDCDVVVIGGGPVGLSLALALARENITCAIFDAIDPERFRSPGFDGRAYAISSASRRLFEHVGVWSLVSGQAQKIDDILVTDGRVSEGASSLFLRFDSAEFGGGGFGHMVEDRFLRPALWQRVAEEPGIAIHAPSRVIALVPETGSVRVETGTGLTVRGRVSAACDGRHSASAERAGITRTGWRYPQTALVCAIRHERPHRSCAHEYFLPAGPFAILPLPGNLSSIVWTEEARAAAYIRQAGSALFDRELRKRVGGFLGDIEVEGGRWFYGLEFSLADSCIAERMALVGDAAHRIHPIAGQGLNVGFLDAAVFAETVGQAARRGEDMGAMPVLERYQSRRRFDATTLAFATDALNRLFSWNRPEVRLMRDLGMAAVGRSGPLRRMFMKRAAGSSLKLPRSMQPGLR